MNSSKTPTSRLWIAASIVVITVAGGALSVFFSSRNSLVVYCAHDSIYSERLLREFERRTGIHVATRFDSEGTKSLGLVNLLLHEQEHPRCDVFWNNELLGMLDLQAAGLLRPYKGPGYERIPDEYKDPDGHWTGFAGRLRVIIVNTDRISTAGSDVARLFRESPENMAIAKPLYGTTRAHFTLLWQRWGEEKLIAWHRDLRERGLLEVRGNAMVKNMVAVGKCNFGWTDTDDYFVAVDQQQPVDIVPVRLDDGKTICIPNTVAIIAGTKQPDAARQLVEFLLSAETEMSLAHSKSRQIPLGEHDPADLPQEVRRLRHWAADACDLRGLAASRQRCLDWLKSEYLQ